jgi:hypothetical protein
MTKTDIFGVRVTAFFLLAYVCFAQLVGISRSQKTVNGAPGHSHQIRVLQADGPLPPPPPPKLGFKSSTVS